MKEYLNAVKDVLNDFSVTDNGLSHEEALKRLEKHGHNKLKEAEKESIFHKFLKELSDPMTIILMVAALISLVTALYSGEGFADVIIIMLVVIINAILGVYQESKAEAALEALAEIAASTTKVIRSGHQETIKSEDLVPGDIIVLEAGDSIPADARLIECASLKVEEAALTGESVASLKTIDTIKADDNSDVPLGDRKNMVYMGTTVVYGRGKALITRTGMEDRKSVV